MFETVTAASPWDVPTAKRTQLIGGAFALHFMAAATYLVLSVWTIGDVAPPKLMDVFTPEVPVPTVVEFEPKRGPENPTKSLAGESIPAPAAPEATQPTTITELPPETIAVIQEPTIGGGFGRAEDVALGEGFGPATGGGGAGEAAITFHSGMSKPVILHRTEPRYPEVARRLHKQGVVVVEAEIGRDGVVRSARAVSALGFGLEESALDALRSWRFTPATLNGAPVAVYYRLSVAFKLQ